VKVLSFALVFAGLVILVVVNAGSGKRALWAGGSIVIVIAALVVMAALFAYFVTRPSL